MDSAERQKVAADALVAFCCDCFRKTGMPAEDARLTALSLVEADLRGVDSHGVVRLAIYVERLVRRAIAPEPELAVARETRSSAVVDGGNGMGQVVGAFAMRRAIRKGEQEGEPAFVAVRNSNHFGAAAWFAEMAISHDMIGFAFTIGGINHMVPWGGAEAMLGNNPFAVALPPPNELPIAAFEDLAAYRRRMAKAARDVRGVRKAPGVDRVFLPGEREAVLLAERRKFGVPLAAEVVRELAEVGRRFGLDFPVLLQGAAPA